MPQIEEAAKVANQRHKTNEKRLAKAKKKLLKITQDAKETIVLQHKNAEIGFDFTTAKQFDLFLRRQQDHEIQESVEQIEKAIEYALQYSFDTE